MAWFIIQCERKTWTKYLVEAESEEAAIENSDNWKYLGYVDGDDTDSGIVGGLFESSAEALADVVSYVEG
jgi:hypothetical protein